MDTDVCIYVVLVLCIIGYVVYVSRDREDTDDLEGFETPETDTTTTDKSSLSLYQRVVNVFQKILDRNPSSDELQSEATLARSRPEYTDDAMQQKLMATPEYKSTQAMQTNTVGDIAGVINEQQIRQTILATYERVWNQPPSDATYAYLRETYVSQLNLNATQLEAYVRQLKAPSRNAKAAPATVKTIDPAARNLYIQIMGEPPASDLEPSIQRVQALLTQSKSADLATEYLWQLRGIRDGATTTKAEERQAILDANTAVLADIRNWEQVMTERAPVSLYRFFGDVYRNQIKRDTLRTVSSALQQADKRAQATERVRGAATASIDSVSAWYRTAQRAAPYQLPTASFIAFAMDRATLKGWSESQAQVFVQAVFAVIREQASRLTDNAAEGKPASVNSASGTTKSRNSNADAPTVSTTKTKDGVTLIIQRPQIYNIYGAGDYTADDGPMGAFLSDPPAVLESIRRSQAQGTLDKDAAAKALDSSEGISRRLAQTRNHRNVAELRYACERSGNCPDEDVGASDNGTGSRYTNADDWGKLRPEFAWMVPQPRPPVCTTAPAAAPPATLYDQSALLGTPLEDAEDTRVGSIMPAFRYSEVPRGRAPPAPRTADVPYEPAPRRAAAPASQ